MTSRLSTPWTIVVTAIALFMVVLDNLVVTTALPSIRTRPRRVRRAARLVRQRVHADVRRAAAPGRGARRPLRPPPRLPARTRALHARLAVRPRSPRAPASSSPREPSRASGAAIVMPLSLTLLSAAVPAPSAAALALGVWSGISGLAIALGPLVGGAVVDGHLLAVDLLAQRPDRPARAAARRARSCVESRGPARTPRPRSACCSRPAGCSGSSAASCAATAEGWSSPEIVAALAARRAGARAVRRLGARAPRRRCCRCASSATARSPSPTSSRCSMSFGIFGSIFLLAQFLQTVQGYSAVRRRTAHAAVDADADVRRADRGRALRPHRRPAADGRRAWRCSRSRSAGSR